MAQARSDAALGALWSRTGALEPGLVGLDLGCGSRKRPGFIGLDRTTVPGVDLTWNLELLPLPFRAGSFDVVFASHLLEHVTDLNRMLEEVARVLKPGGLLQITVPWAGDLRAFQDPTHVRFFTLRSFEYFVREGATVGGWYLRKPFRRIRRRSFVFRLGPLSLPLALAVNRSSRIQAFYEASPLRLIAARDMHVELER